ncbi:MAG: BON domain-containing protein [Ginsengibacter sp.]
MEDSNRRNRYQDDNRSSSYDKNREMNWDRNDKPSDSLRRPEDKNKNVYSGDREQEYWNARNNRMNNLSADRNYNDYDNQYSGNFRRNQTEDFRNQRYNTKKSYMNHPEKNDSNYNDYNKGNRDYNSSYRNENWRDNSMNEDRGWWDKTKDEVASWFGDDDAERRLNRDEMSSGQHRGKGPKNYTRSEERIKEDVSDILANDSFLDASDIEVSVKGSEVTLDGYVDSRYSKHRSEDLAEDIMGVTHVQNNLRVHENSYNPNNVTKTAVITDKIIPSNSSYNTTKNNKQTSNV